MTWPLVYLYVQSHTVDIALTICAFKLEVKVALLGMNGTHCSVKESPEFYRNRH